MNDLSAPGQPADNMQVDNDLKGGFARGIPYSTGVDWTAPYLYSFPTPHRFYIIKMLSCFGVLRRTFTTTSIVTHKSWVAWSAPELETVRRLMHQKSDKEIALLLPNRSVLAVTQKRTVLTEQRSKPRSHSADPTGGARHWTEEAIQRLRKEAGPETTINMLARSFPQASHASIQAKVRKYELPFLRESHSTKGKHWTSEEDSILLEYKHEGPNALAARLSRSPRAIQRRFYNLPEQQANATSPRRGRPWTDADTKLMVDLFNEGYLSRYVAERLQRTTTAILDRMYRLKISTRGRKMSPAAPASMQNTSVT